VGPGNHASAVQWNKTTSWPSRLTPGCRPVVDRRTEHAGRRGPPNGATRRSSSPPTTSSSTSTGAAAEPFVGAQGARPKSRGPACPGAWRIELGWGLPIDTRRCGRCPSQGPLLTPSNFAPDGRDRPGEMWSAWR
jgi:hypothetical protein